MLGGRYAKDVFGFKMGNCVELNMSELLLTATGDGSQHRGANGRVELANHARPEHNDVSPCGVKYHLAHLPLKKTSAAERNHDKWGQPKISG